MLSIFQYLLAVDEYMQHASGKLMRFREGRMIGNEIRVENDNVCQVAGRKQPTCINLQLKPDCRVSIR
jgi:hypothetical protein